jgi:transcriptional regulator with GAF, ATPase, and Fis domain
MKDSSSSGRRFLACAWHTCGLTSRLRYRRRQQRYIRETLEVTGGRISGRKGAAEILGLHPNTLRSKMERLYVHRSAT